MRAFILIFNLIIAYLLLSGWPDFLPMWSRAALALIIVMVAVPLSDVSSNSERKFRMSSLRSPKWLDYLYIGSVIFGIELLLLAVFTLGPRMTEEMHEDVKIWLTREAPQARTTVVAPGELRHAVAGNWLWDNHFRRSHPKQARKQPPNKPEIFMEITSVKNLEVLQKHTLYLRTFALDAFNGDTWSIYQPTVLDLEKPESGDIEITPINTNWRSVLPLYKHKITQPYYEYGQNLLTSLHNTISTDIPSLRKVSTDTYILPRDNKGAFSYSYSAVSQPLLLDRIKELDKNIKVGKTPHDVYLSKVNNPSLQQRLTEFASSVDRSLPLIQQLKKLKEMMNTQCSYSLKIENKEKINALENFLFVEKKGYCEFYASAAAMLCRELGIPSRVAFGWSGGKFYKSSNLYVFRSKHAHAWTEVYLDGYGWVIYDTTPPSAIVASESKGGEVPPEVDEFIDYPEEYGDDQEEDKITWANVWIVFAVLIVVIMVLLVVRRFTQPIQRSSVAAYVENEPKYMQIFQKVSTKLGYPVKPSQTLMQSVQNLKDQQLEISGLTDLLDEILNYHYDIVYRNAPEDKAKESKIRADLKKVTKQIENDGH